MNLLSEAMFENHRAGNKASSQKYAAAAVWIAVDFF